VMLIAIVIIIIAAKLFNLDQSQILWLREDKREFPVQDANSQQQQHRGGGRFNQTRRNMGE
jgi:hypothetical protein